MSPELVQPAPRHQTLTARVPSGRPPHAGPVGGADTPLSRPHTRDRHTPAVPADGPPRAAGHQGTGRLSPGTVCRPARPLTLACPWRRPPRSGRKSARNLEGGSHARPPARGAGKSRHGREGRPPGAAADGLCRGGCGLSKGVSAPCLLRAALEHAPATKARRPACVPAEGLHARLGTGRAAGPSRHQSPLLGQSSAALN